MREIQPHSARSLRLPAGECVTLRPIGPCDRDPLQGYVRGLSRESRYNRFFHALQELPRADLDRVLHFDQKYQLALLAETCMEGLPIGIGEIRCAFATDRFEAECALSVADAWHGRGLGTLLVADIECRARCLGARYLSGDVLRSNAPMKALARKTGFLAADVPRDARLIRIVKDLVLSRTAGAGICGVTASFVVVCRCATGEPLPCKAPHQAVANS